jgi:citrate synthase
MSSQVEKDILIEQFKAGLEDIPAAVSDICFVDGINSLLVYRGYDVTELAAKATFEEVAYLLWFGKLPNKREYEWFTRQLIQERELPAHVLAIVTMFPGKANPMAALRTAISAMSMYDPDSSDQSSDAIMRKAIRLTARIPTMIGVLERLRTGQQPLASRPDLGHAANYLYMLTGREPEEMQNRAMDLSLILQADHELNASTFAARVTVSTLSDIYAGVVSAIGTLAGPLHGGANEQVMRMLIEIDKLENTESYIKGLFAQKKRVMGFGHRVYKGADPRALVLKKWSQMLGEGYCNSKWWAMSEAIEEVVIKEKGIYPNVDFYNASVLYCLGIPLDMFTPVFASSRIVGWTAHIMEQFADNRLIRPRAIYTGPEGLEYAPIDERS